MYAYVTENYTGLRVVDIGTPALPEIVGGIGIPGNTLGVAVQGD